MRMRTNTRTQVGNFVRPFNHDGHTFIRTAVDLILEASNRGDHATLPTPKMSRKAKDQQPPPNPVRIPVPPTVSHFVMNLPASALEFLHNFRGLYQGHESLFAPHTATPLPMVHAHCFAPKPNDEAAVQSALDRVEKQIGMKLTPGDGQMEGQVTLHEVRDVAPNKLMFCVSFRLPREVAFAPRV